MIIKFQTTLFFILLNIACYGQDTPLSVRSDTTLQEVRDHNYSKTRLKIAAAGNLALWAGSFYVLNKSWYADFPRTSFHFFNDNPEWQQMDKLGHVWTSYQVSRLSAETWKWTGLKETKSVVIGGISGVGYLTLIEILDGYSSQWGFSWGDMAANISGSAAFVSQELLWKDQRVSIKFSYWPYDYPDELADRRNQMFGKNFRERILKDYNGQTYWASANIKSFVPSSRLPPWLNIAFGYSADGMMGGRMNTWTDRSGLYHDRRDIIRTRHLYVSPDIDFTRIHTNKKLIRKVFFVLNAFKFPAPALKFSSKGGLTFQAIAF